MMEEQGSWMQRVTARWSSGASESGQRRWVRVGADVGLALFVIGVIAVLTVPASPSVTAPVQVQSPVLEPPAPAVETALEHARQHMQPGYRCPIHPEVVSETPGRCLICGEALVPAVSTMKPSELHPVDVVAYVDNSHRNRDVIPESEGWVERIVKAKVGQRVKQGDVLLEIYSPGLVQLQMDYLDGQRRKDALALIDARNRLRAHGQTDESIRALALGKKADGVIRVRAPGDGMITEVYAPEGIFVPQGIAVVDMVDVSSLWMSAKVPLSKIMGLAPGVKVEARSPLLGNEVLLGQTVAVDRLAAGDDALTVQVRFDNSSQKLAERHYADLRIFPAQPVSEPLLPMVNADWLDY
ncbi:MAG: efflux RND transporter periplasmic adaptor subunit [Gammaproteobacteria bacterium]|nr:efflux RND transporter periplasmic adaptor subunit [Gammaproteobacteria bacterium]